MISATEFSADGKRLAVCAESGVGIIFDVSIGIKIAEFNGPSEIEDLAWNPRRTRLAGANREVVAVLDEQGRGIISLKSDPRFGDLPFDARVVFSPDGKWIAANQWNNKIRIWKSR